MYEIDNEKLGNFIVQLRKEKHWTQKELAEDAVLGKEEVERLVTRSVDMSVNDRTMQQAGRKRVKLVYMVTLCVVIAELLLLWKSGMSVAEMFLNNVFTVEILMLIFGGWFCFFAKEKLPTYYDENKINFVSDRVFRMNMPGLHFNNSNWPHILEAMRVWTLAVAMVYPIIVHLLVSVSYRMRFDVQDVLTILMFPILFSLMIVVYGVGKKYE